MRRIFAAALFMALSSLVALGQTESRAETLKQIELKRAELASLALDYLRLF